MFLSRQLHKTSNKPMCSKNSQIKNCQWEVFKSYILIILMNVFRRASKMPHTFNNSRYASIPISVPSCESVRLYPYQYLSSLPVNQLSVHLPTVQPSVYSLGSSALIVESLALKETNLFLIEEKSESRSFTRTGSVSCYYKAYMQIWM